MSHEIGEKKLGDLPDDGRRDEEAKNRTELEAIRDFCRTLPPDLGNRLLNDFMELQTRNSRRGQIAFCIDKSEAVLQSLLYEADGRGGNLTNKAITSKISEQDAYYMRMTKSSALVDNWAAHFLDKAKGMECLPVFEEILRAAVENVRGKWFDWR